jgi:hypothetical protein
MRGPVDGPVVILLHGSLDDIHSFSGMWKIEPQVLRLPFSAVIRVGRKYSARCGSAMMDNLDE